VFLRFEEGDGSPCVLVFRWEAAFLAAGLAFGGLFRSFFELRAFFGVLLFFFRFWAYSLEFFPWANTWVLPASVWNFRFFFFLFFWACHVFFFFFSGLFVLIGGGGRGVFFC